MALKLKNNFLEMRRLADPLAGLFWLPFGLMMLFLIILTGGLLSYCDWETVRSVIQEPEFQFALRFTMITSLLATCLATLMALPCAFILSRYNLPLKEIWDTLLDIPIILPPLVSGIALLILFGPVFGSHLAEVGIDVVFTQKGVVLAQWFIATPFAVKAFRQAFDSIDPRMEKVARTLGFRPVSVFFRVTLPLAKNGIISGIIMAWARSLGEFGATAMLAGITRLKTETLSVAVFLNMSIGEMEFAISTAMLMLVMALGILVSVKVILRNEVRL